MSLKETLTCALYTTPNLPPMLVTGFRRKLKAAPDAVLAEVEEMLIEAAPHKGVSLPVDTAAGSPTLGTVNWAGILSFVQVMLPLILQLIAEFNPPKPTN